MRNKLLLSAAAIALATPALAADLYAPYVAPINDPVYTPGPMVVGHLSMGIGFVDAGDFGHSKQRDFDDTSGIFTGVGRANVNLGGAWNLQLETGGASAFNNGFSYSSIGAGAHLWTKLNGAAVGVFGAVDFPTGATVGTVGIEGEVYLGNVTLGADAAYSWSDNFGDSWKVGGDADFYLAPDFKIGAELAYLDFDSGGDAWTAGLDTEYRFTGTPFSAWGEVAYADLSGGGDIWSGMVGVRVFMDAPGTTLQQHDRDVPWDGLRSSEFVGYVGGLVSGL